MYDRVPILQGSERQKICTCVPAQESKIGFLDLAGIQPNSRQTKSVETDFSKAVNYTAGAIIVASQLALTTSSCLS
jgi:hypothetical protein